MAGRLALNFQSIQRTLSDCEFVTSDGDKSRLGTVHTHPPLVEIQNAANADMLKTNSNFGSGRSNSSIWTPVKCV